MLVSVTTDMSPTGDLLVTSIVAGEVSPRALYVLRWQGTEAVAAHPNYEVRHGRSQEHRNVCKSLFIETFAATFPCDSHDH